MKNLRPLRLFLVLTSLALLPITGRAADLAIPGIDNFVQVNDRLFRGAQPADHAWPKLAELGVRTVVDLRRDTEHSKADEAKAVQAAGMKYVSFPMNGFDTPTAEQMERVLAMLDESGPVFVHCKQGRDRTGTVVAAYRIAREGWSNDKALDEAKSHGMHWYEKGMKRFLSSYQPRTSPEKLVGGSAPITPAAPAPAAAPAAP